MAVRTSTALMFRRTKGPGRLRPLHEVNTEAQMVRRDSRIDARQVTANTCYNEGVDRIAANLSALQPAKKTLLFTGQMWKRLRHRGFLR